MIRRVKTAFVLFWVLLVACSASAQEYPTKQFPRFETVVQQFFQTYDLRSAYLEVTTKFEKRKDGWHVSIYEYSGSLKLVKTALYWSASAREYKELDFDKSKPGNPVEIPANLKDEWTLRAFNSSVYLGYSGWERDVIDELKTHTDLNDSLFYILGRAYASRATNLISNQNDFPDEHERFTLPEHKDALSPDQLKLYREYEHKAIECFEKVTKLNPSFGTIVGNIGFKTCNEYVNAYVSLLMVQDEQEARKELPDKMLYDEFVISYAKNLLSMCAKDAILFVNGDNDTFPLLYVQTKLGYRTDVRLVNAGLLRLPRYIDMLRETFLKSAPLPLTLTHEQYWGDVREVVYVRQQAKFMKINKAFQLLNDTCCKPRQGDSLRPWYFPSNRLLLSDEKGMEYSITLSQAYLLKNDLMLLDLLAHNHTRPMYVANTCEVAFYSPYMKFLTNEGPAWHFVFQKQTDSINGQYNTGVNYQNLLNQFEWKGLGSALPEADQQLALNYQIVFWDLADALMRAHQEDSAKTALHKAVALFPDNVIPWGEVMLNYVYDYFVLGDTKDGLETARIVLPRLTGNPRRNEYLQFLHQLAKTTYSRDLQDLLAHYPE